MDQKIELTVDMLNLSALARAMGWKRSRLVMAQLRERLSVRVVGKVIIEAPANDTRPTPVGQ